MPESMDRSSPPDDAVRPETAASTVALVGDAYLHPPVIVARDMPLRDAVRRMKAEQGSCILVDGAERAEDLGSGVRLGILTDAEMRDLVILDGVAPDTPVGPLARPILQLVSPDDALFNAVALLTRHAERRVVVAKDGVVQGVLEQTDALAHLADNSHAVALRIDRATTPEELAAAGRDMQRHVTGLRAVGVRVALISRLTTTLNRKLFRRLFDMTAPPELVADSCLIVMGSEGRGEQILKTDQDNGLILRNPLPAADLTPILAEFSRRLETCGYPPCPGRIMVSNPDWARPLSAYRESLFKWLHRPDGERLMNLAIFFDAAAAAGDVSLLPPLKTFLFEQLQNNQGFFYNFAKPVLAFDTPAVSRFGGLLERRLNEPLDIKKTAIFPLVHGVRAYALEHRLLCTHTTERLHALADRRALDAGQARELADVFDFLSTLRLDARLASAPDRAPNIIRPDGLSKADYDRLRDCLEAVRRFKETVARHFHLDR